MIFGLILAGGRSSRFGEEKAVATLGGKTFIEAALSVLQQGCGEIAVNAKPGSGAARFAETRKLLCLSDPPGTLAGPLAGVLTGLSWADERGAKLLATIPCDTPFLPPDLIARLTAALANENQASAARTVEGLQPLCAVWRVSALGTVQQALSGLAHPPVHEVALKLNAAEVQFAQAWRFANINTQAEFIAAKTLSRN